MTGLEAEVDPVVRQRSAGAEVWLVGRASQVSEGLLDLVALDDGIEFAVEDVEPDGGFGVFFEPGPAFVVAGGVEFVASCG